MSLKMYWRCEGTTLDATHDFSAGDTTATVQGTVSIDAAAAFVGTNGILVGAGNSHYRFDTASLTNASTGAVGVWVRIATDSTSSLSQVWLIRGTNASDFYAVQANAGFDTNAGTFRFSFGTTAGGGSNGSVITTAANLTVNTWYFVVAKWDQPNSLRRIEVYNSSMTLLEGVTNSSAYTAPADLSVSAGIRIGEASGTSVVQHLDNWFLGDAYADGDVFVSNASITSYTAYGGGDPAPSITDVDTDDTITLEQANVVITGTDFDTATVEIRQDGFAYTPSVDSQNATTITFDMIAIGDTGPISAPHAGSAVLAVINGDDQEDTISITITDETGTATVLIGTPNADPDLRLTASADAVAGDYVRISNVQGGTIADVTVNDDLTWDAEAGVTAFDVQYWDMGDGTYGDRATQTVDDGAEDDTTPDAFSFVDQFSVARSDAIVSAPITVTGIDAATAITVSDGEYSINGGSATSDPGTVSSGDLVRAHHTSSANYSTLTSTTVTIGGVSDVFSSLTIVDPSSLGSHGHSAAPGGVGRMMVRS